MRHRLVFSSAWKLWEYTYSKHVYPKMKEQQRFWPWKEGEDS